MPRGVSRHDEAQLQRRLWTPHALRPSVALWLDAGELPKMVVDSSTRVTDWSDLLGQRIALGDGVTGANRPLWNIGASQPYSHVYFSSSVNQFLNLSSSIAYSGSDGLCVVAVAELRAGRAYQTIIGHNSGGLQIRWEYSTGLIQCLRAAQAGVITSTAAASGVGPHIISAQFATNYAEVAVNGSRNTNTTNPAFTNPITCVGNRATADGEAMVGGILGILVFSRRLSSADVARAEGYLAWRAGVQKNLAGTHPYKNAPPLIGG